MHAEKFGASFMLIKSDIGGNIDRLENARSKDAQKYATLFSIIEDEISREEQAGRYSDSKALLWLKRCSLLNDKCCIANYLQDDLWPMFSMGRADVKQGQGWYRYRRSPDGAGLCPILETWIFLVIKFSKLFL